MVDIIQRDHKKEERLPLRVSYQLVKEAGVERTEKVTVYNDGSEEREIVESTPAEPRLKQIAQKKKETERQEGLDMVAHFVQGASKRDLEQLRELLGKKKGSGQS